MTERRRPNKWPCPKCLREAGEKALKEVAESALSAQQAQIRALQGYAQHKITCPANPENDITVNGLPWKHCNCGLSAFLIPET